MAQQLLASAVETGEALAVHEEGDFVPLLALPQKVAHHGAQDAANSTGPVTMDDLKDSDSLLTRTRQSLL